MVVTQALQDGSCLGVLQGKTAMCLRHLHFCCRPVELQSSPRAGPRDAPVTSPGSLSASDSACYSPSAAQSSPERSFEAPEVQPQSDEGTYMQNYQTTLGQAPSLQQRSRTSSSAMQKGPSRTSSFALQQEHSFASSAQAKQQRQQSLAASQGSYELSEAASDDFANPRQRSVAMDDSSLIAAIQTPANQQQESGQTEATAAAIRAKPRKSSAAKSSVLGARKTSVADRLKSLRGMVDADVEIPQVDGDAEIQEDLPAAASPPPLEYGNVDEPILEEAELVA